MKLSLWTTIFVQFALHPWSLLSAPWPWCSSPLPLPGRCGFTIKETMDLGESHWCIYEVGEIVYFCQDGWHWWRHFFILQSFQFVALHGPSIARVSSARARGHASIHQRRRRANGGWWWFRFGRIHQLVWDFWFVKYQLYWFCQIHYE